MIQFQFIVQLEGVFNFPPIPVGNKTERKRFKFLTPSPPPRDSTYFSGNTAMKIQIRFLRRFEWDCRGLNHS